MKLSFEDKIFDSIKYGYDMPVKGHTKIELTNVKNGSREIIEKDNMVTNAVSDLLASNWCGLCDFKSLTPIRKLFGGILLFTNPLTESASGYNIPSDSVNPMIGHAGPTSHSTASPYRGNPNGGETIMTDSGITMVFDFFTSQGNGQISSCCCTSDMLGDMGLKPFDSSLNTWKQIGITNQFATKPTSMTRAEAMKHPITIEPDGRTGRAIYWTGTTFEEITVKHDWLKFGLMLGYNDFIEVSNRHCTTRSFTAWKTSICQDDDYYYCYEITSATSLKVDRISKSNMTVTQMDKTYSGINLNTSSWSFLQAFDCWRTFPKFPFDGTYLYLPKSGNGTFYKLNIFNAADATELTTPNGALDIKTSSDSGSDQTWTRITPITLSSGLIYGENYLINGSNAYPIKGANTLQSPTGSTSFNYTSLWSTNRFGTAVYACGMDTTTGQQPGKRQGQAPINLGMYLATINNLQEPVTKTTAHTMKVSYTLTEV